MKKTRTLSAIGASLAMVGGLIALPSASMAATTTTTINLDCDNPLYADDYAVLPGDNVTIVSVNCDELYKDGNRVDVAEITIESSELSTETNVDLDYYFGDIKQWVSFYFYLAGPDVTDLTPLELARTETLTIPATSPSWLSIHDDSADLGDDFALGENSDCMLEVGDHPYTATSLNIASSGDFTFRVSETSPRTDQNLAALELNSLAYGINDIPISDPFLAVYTTFDPENPNDNIVGCNDDRPNFGYRASGTIFSDLWPQFDASLEPGTYTLVMTTYDESDSNDWAATSNSTAQTASMELWGTTGAITPTVPADDKKDEPALAATGSSHRGLPIGLSMAAIGLLMLAGAAAVRRRRINA